MSTTTWPASNPVTLPVADPFAQAAGRSTLTAALGVATATGHEDVAIMHLGDERMVSRLIGDLGVDTSQADEIREIHAATADATTADRERLQVLRDELRNLRDPFDPGEAQELADEIGEITSRLVYEMSAVRAALRTVLTDDQRERLDALREEHKDRRHGKSRGHDPRQR